MFKWQEPFDNGGSNIVEYEIKISSTTNQIKKTIINSLVYDFVASEGMQKGKEYKIKIRAKNFFTHFYNVGD